MRKSLSLLLVINCSLLILLQSCSSSKQIGKQAKQYVLSDSNLATAHIGICVYNATDNRYLYNYQSDKFFIPASNTKIITCYAAMKHLGDSLVGLRYTNYNDTEIAVFPTGDPTFLHDDFKQQPVLEFLKAQTKRMLLLTPNWDEKIWGVGWSWDDYAEDYMPERSPLPVSGNTLKIRLTNSMPFSKTTRDLFWEVSPHLRSAYVQPIVTLHGKFNTLSSADSVLIQKTLTKFYLTRDLQRNEFYPQLGSSSVFKNAEIPFVTYRNRSAIEILNGQYGITNIYEHIYDDHYISDSLPFHLSAHLIHSQPTDSLLKIMMHRSDNFYAEQSLLMIGNEMLGVMNDEKVIDTLLKTDYKDMPQRPQWIDGSGLSRFNLFTPQDFVFVLNKMRTDYSWSRISTIFETGGTGTLNNYYKNLRGKIFAKTGSLSNNIALSGYLITPKNKTLIFSVLVNNHTAGATAVRRAVERFLTQVQAGN